MKKRWSRLIPAFALTIAFLLTDAPVPVAAAAEEELKIRENIYVDGMTVGGMTESEALTALERREESLKDVELTLTSEYGDVETTLGDLGYYGDVETAVREAVGYGNTGSVLKRYKEQHSGEESKKIDIHRSVSESFHNHPGGTVRRMDMENARHRNAVHTVSDTRTVQQRICSNYQDRRTA